MPRLNRLKEAPPGPRLFRSDAPPTDLEGERDAFGHKAYATAIASALVEAEPPYTFGLFGPFGLGKTTVIEEVRRQLGGRAAVVVFDAWRYEGDTLRRHFLREAGQQLVDEGELPGSFVEDSLDELDASRVTPGPQRILGFDKAEIASLALRLFLVAGLFWLAWLAEPKLSADLGHDEVVKIGLPIIVALATLLLVPLSRIVRVETESVSRGELKPELFAQKFSDLLSKIQSDRLVVVIDNLDRCSATRIEELFFTLSTYLEPVGKPKNRGRIAIVRPRKRKDAVFLLAADAEALRRHLEARELKASEGTEVPEGSEASESTENSERTDTARELRDDTGRYADDYLRKIVKASLTMKPLLADDMREYVATQLKDFTERRKVGPDDAALLVEITTAALRQNPRRVKEFASNLELQLRVVEAREAAKAIAPEISGDVLLAAKVQLLQEEWPEKYAHVERDDRVLDMWHAAIPAGEHKGIPGRVDPRFEAFMNVSRGVSSGNLRPFLRLKQSRAEVELPRYADFHEALVGGRTSAVEEIVTDVSADAGKYAKEVTSILRNELRRGYLAGARNVVQVAVSSKALKTQTDALRATLSLAADNKNLRGTLRSADPSPLLEAGQATLDRSRLELLIEPFIGVNEIYAESPEHAQDALRALIALGRALSKARRRELTSALGEAGDGAAFDLFALAAKSDPRLLPANVGEKAVAVLADIDIQSPQFQAFSGWLHRKSPEQGPQTTFANLVSQKISSTFAPGVADAAAERPWLRAVGATLGILTHIDTGSADGLRAAVADSLQRGVASGLENELFDILETAVAWGTEDASNAQADELIEWYDSSSRADFLDYVKAHANRWTAGKGFGWRIQSRLRHIIRDSGDADDVVLRAAGLNALIDPKDKEEVVGGSIPVLVAAGAFSKARALRSQYPNAAASHAENARAAALSWANDEVPEISQEAFDFLIDIHGEFDEDGHSRLQEILRQQVDSGTGDQAEAALAAADRFADASPDFTEQRLALLRDLFDRIASADTPPDRLPRLLAARSASLDRDRKDSLAAQLARWVRTPGTHQTAVAHAIGSFADPTADHRFEFVEALAEAETASIGNLELRTTLLRIALDVQGRANTRAANRIADRLKALRKEKTDENKELLQRLAVT